MRAFATVSMQSAGAHVCTHCGNEQVSEGVKQTVAQVADLSEMDVGALKDSISVRTTAAVSAVSDYW